MRERIDELALQISRIGTNASYLSLYVEEIREILIIGVWRDTFKAYPDKLALLDSAEATHAEHKNTMMATEWLRQVANPVGKTG